MYIKKYSNGFYTILLFFGFFISLVLVLHNKWGRGYSHDEFESIHTSWLILNGGNIYSDFFQHHNPLFYYLITPFVYFFGESIVTLSSIRIFIGILFLINFYIIYLYYKIYRINNYIVGFLMLLSIQFYSDRLLEIRPDTCMYTSLLYGTYQFLNFINKKRRVLYI